jgi:hypothetical protein
MARSIQKGTFVGWYRLNSRFRRTLADDFDARCIMIRFLAAAILCGLTLSMFGCAGPQLGADNTHRFNSDPYNYEFSRNL